MLKLKVIKTILDELKLKADVPFLIKNFETPYRIRKNGEIERFIGDTWSASSNAYYDIVSFADNGDILPCEVELVEKKGKRK